MKIRPAMRSSLAVVAIAAVAVLFSCESPSGSENGNGQPQVPPALGSDKDITAWSIPSLGVTGLISGTNHTISATVPHGTDRSSLVAAFETTGTSVTVGGVAQISGTTANDFRDPCTYVVAAEDGSLQSYVVTVTEALSSAKSIATFSFEAARNPGKGLTADCEGMIVEGEDAGAIAVTLPFGSSRSGLVASFETTGASVNAAGVAQASGSTANTFTSDVTYTVVAADGSSRDYVVTVAVAPSPARALTGFRFKAALNPGKGFSSDREGSIVEGEDAGTIAVTLPYGSSRSGLVASFATTGASVSVGGVAQAGDSTANDFGSPVHYLVHAADGTTRDYTITVTVALSPAKSIDSYSILGQSGTITSDAIYVRVPYTQDVRSLVAKFSYTGASIAVGSTPQVSEATANDFCALGYWPPTIVYTVTAQDGSTQDIPVFLTMGTISTLSGTSGLMYSTWPHYMCADASSLYLVNSISSPRRIERMPISSPGTVTVSADLREFPERICAVGSYVYFTDVGYSIIGRVATAASSNMELLAGSNTGAKGLVDDVGTAARFNWPTGIASDGSYLYICDMANHAIRRATMVVNSSDVRTLCSGLSADISDIACAGGYLYVTCPSSNNILRIGKATGTSMVFSGSEGGESGIKDGSASVARFSGPKAIVTDGSSYLYVLDEGNQRIRRVSIADGSVLTLTVPSDFYYGSPDPYAGQTLVVPTTGLAYSGGKLYFWDDKDASKKIRVLQ